MLVKMEENSWNILLIEDDEDDYLIARALLADAGCRNCRLKWVVNAAAGLEALETERWDVILVDYDLGASNGLQFVEAAVSRNYPAPIILLTGLGGYQVDLEAMYRGATDFLSKGEVTPALLERAIRYAIESKRTENALRQAQDTLEKRVQNRTYRLHQANETLREEIKERLHFEEQVRRQNERSRLLADLSKELAESGRDFDRVLEIILKGIVDHLNSAAAILLLNDDGDNIQIVAVSSPETGPASDSLRAALEDACFQKDIIWQCVRSGEPLIIPQESGQRSTLEFDEFFHSVLKPMGIHDFIVYPLKVQGTIIGALCAAHLQPDQAYNSEENSFTEDLASRAAQAILNARLFETLESELFERRRVEKELAEVQRQLIASLEAERLEIAQELHDVSMQELYALMYKLKEVENDVLQGKTMSDFSTLRQRIQGIIDSLRTIAGELRPPTLAPYGLEKAIRSHAENFLTLHPDLQLRLELASDGQRLGESMRFALFRIYQTAMANIARHSHATQATVRFELDESMATLEIEDNGIGFQVPERWIDLARKGHLGLISASERAEAIGGHLQAWSKPDGGTTLRVSAPVNTESN
jgi:signal transduction histidine kinase/FixJ family two-component response regulator